VGPHSSLVNKTVLVCHASHDLSSAFPTSSSACRLLVCVSRPLVGISQQLVGGAHHFVGVRDYLVGVSRHLVGDLRLLVGCSQRLVGEPNSRLAGQSVSVGVSRLCWRIFDYTIGVSTRHLVGESTSRRRKPEPGLCFPTSGLIFPIVRRRLTTFVGGSQLSVGGSPRVVKQHRPHGGVSFSPCGPGGAHHVCPIERLGPPVACSGCPLASGRHKKAPPLATPCTKDTPSTPRRRATPRGRRTNDGLRALSLSVRRSSARGGRAHRVPLVVWAPPLSTASPFLPRAARDSSVAAAPRLLSRPRRVRRGRLLTPMA